MKKVNILILIAFFTLLLKAQSFWDLNTSYFNDCDVCLVNYFKGDTSRTTLENFLKKPIPDDYYRHSSMMKRVDSLEKLRRFATTLLAKRFGRDALPFIKQYCKPHKVDSLYKYYSYMIDYYPSNYYYYAELLGFLGDSTGLYMMDSMFQRIDPSGYNDSFSKKEFIFYMMTKAGYYKHAAWLRDSLLSQSMEEQKREGGSKINGYEHYIWDYMKDPASREWIHQYLRTALQNCMKGTRSWQLFYPLWQIDSVEAIQLLNHQLRTCDKLTIREYIYFRSRMEPDVEGRLIRELFHRADTTSQNQFFTDYSRSGTNRSLLTVQYLKFLQDLNPKKLPKYARITRKWFLESFEGKPIPKEVSLSVKLDSLLTRLQQWKAVGGIGPAATADAFANRLNAYKAISNPQTLVDSLDEWHFDLYRLFHTSRGKISEAAEGMLPAAYHHLNVTRHNIVDSIGIPSSRHYLPAPLVILSKDINVNIAPDHRIRIYGLGRFIDSVDYNRCCEVIQGAFTFNIAVKKKLWVKPLFRARKLSIRGIVIVKGVGPSMSMTIYDSTRSYRKVNPNLFATLPANRVTINENTLSHTTLGQVEDITVYYANHDLILGNGFTGHGFLVVDGHLTLQGNAHWHGLVVVRHKGNTPPQLTMTDSSRVTGAVALSNPLSTPAGLTLKDNVGIYFSNFVNAFILREYYGKGE